MASERQVNLSGAGLPASGLVTMVQLFARSGAALLEVHCDSLGRIGSVSI